MLIFAIANSIARNKHGGITCVQARDIGRRDYQSAHFLPHEYMNELAIEVRIRAFLEYIIAG